MPNIYNMPNLTDSQNIFTLTRYVNNEADGLVFAVTMFVIWITIFNGTKQYSSGKAFAYASLVSAILAIPLAVLTLLAPKFMYLFVILAGIGFVWLKLAEARPTY